MRSTGKLKFLATELASAATALAGLALMAYYDFNGDAVFGLFMILLGIGAFAATLYIRRQCGIRIRR